MKVKSIFWILALSGSLVLLNSCAKAPQQLIDSATAAVDSAKAAEADRYVPDEFQSLQDTLNAAIAEIENQNSKFFLSRDYGRAKQLLESVTAMAPTITENAGIVKEEMRVQIQESLAQLQVLLQENKGLIAKAPTGKEGRAALEMIQDEITVVEASLNEVNTLITNGDYLSAKDKIDAGITKVQSINDELKEAIAKRTAISRKTTN